MKLLTQEIRNSIPKLREQENLGDKAIIHVKFFNPCGTGTWYATEGEPVFDDDGVELEYMFFGLVDLFERELGYFSLGELESVKGHLGLGIERDLYFAKNRTLSEIM